MKLLQITFILALILCSCGQQATAEQTKTTTVTNADGKTESSFKVWGNCEQCKETIESALKIDGISKSDWNVDSKIIKVEYDSSKIKLPAIHKKIAEAGYDNVGFKSEDEAYNSLPNCCQYERK